MLFKEKSDEQKNQESREWLLRKHSVNTELRAMDSFTKS